MMSGSPSLASFSGSNVLQWKPDSLNSTRFYFKATDECNASSTFNMTVDILTCPCTDKGVCVPDPNHPRGSGMYYCKCHHGYEGQTCEKEIDECLQSPCVHGRWGIERNDCYIILYHTKLAIPHLLSLRNISNNFYIRQVKRLRIHLI